MTRLRPSLTPVLELLAPSRCLACRRRGGMPWCHECAPGARARVPRCRRCDARLVQSPPTQPGCPLIDGDVSRVVARHDYSGVVAAAIRGAKLDRCPAAYPPMARALADTMARRWHGDAAVDVVTGVPVPRHRRRRRGFDHAMILARVVAAELGLPAVPLLAVPGRAGDRGAHGPDAGVAPMVAMTAVSGHVLVVDDVVTTGATVRASARILVGAGAARVSVAAVARAGTHGR